jgi:hypothetical protein
MLQVGFEPMIPAFEGTKTIHALDCATTVIGRKLHMLKEFWLKNPRLK